MLIMETANKDLKVNWWLSFMHEDKFINKNI
jgi:hypothetical protein